jgi:hypothetical protein
MTSSAPANPSACQPGVTPHVAIAPGGSSNFSLIIAAVAAGRLPGEPAIVLTSRGRRPLLARLFGSRVRSPLADPRLEVVRAISASLSTGMGIIRADLLAAADHVGLNRDDLCRAFPGIAIAGVVS